MGKILPKTPRVLNQFYKRYTTTHNSNNGFPVLLKKLEGEETDKGRTFNRSANLNMDVIEEGGYSDVDIGPFLNVTLDEFQEGE